MALEIESIAAQLELWGHEQEVIYTKTKDIEYRRSAVHLRYIAAFLYRYIDAGGGSIPTLDMVTTAGNTTLNSISVGGISAVLTNAITPYLVYYNTATGELTYAQSKGVSPGLFSQTGDSVAITNTIIPGNLLDGGVGTLTVPANGFQVGDAFIAYFSGKISNKNNEQLEIRVLSSAVLLADTGIMTLPATTNKDWELYINFTVRTIGAAGVAQMATSGRFTFSKDASNSPDSIGFYNLNNTTFNTTISNTLNVTAQWGAADPLNSIQTNIFNLYRIY